jgi:hypothetical protein
VVRRSRVFGAGAGSGVAGVLLAVAGLWPVTVVAEAPVRKDVLLLYADSMLLPANAVVDRELRSALGAEAAIQVLMSWYLQST